MTKSFAGALAASTMLLCAGPALANTDAEMGTAAVSNEEIIATAIRPDDHGPAGTMADHVHKRGGLMFGLMWMHEGYAGANRQGTSKISDQAIADAGYTVKADAMTMDMAMMHIMYAPSDRVTLMVVPSWMRMGMRMEGLPMASGGGHHEEMGAMPMAATPMAAMDDHGGHGLMPGQTMSHSVEGMGDTQFGALVSLSTRPALSSHVGLMVSAPTGKVTRRNAMGAYVHYMMQGGSGTWDVTPSLTVRGMNEHWGWGAQLSYLLRMEDRNKAGFRFGNRFGATAWVSKPLGKGVALAARLSYSDEGRIKGHYNGAHGHASPPDLQGNYGGQRLETSLGLNAMLGDRLRIGAEAGVPVYQKVNGIQLPKTFGLNVNASLMF